MRNNLGPLGRKERMERHCGLMETDGSAEQVQEEDAEQRALPVQHQEVWSWGAGTEGQLGTAKLQDELLPQLILPPSAAAAAAGSPISLLACGGAHVIALTPGGRVLTWGRGTSGQLGHGESMNSLQPKPVMALESFFITHASAGWSHSGFVSDTGCLFTCGHGSFGQLGHGDYKSQCSPIEVSYFNSRHVKQIACGMRHSLVLLRGSVDATHSRDQVYGFGSGKRGQLGVSKARMGKINLPQVTLGLDDVEIVSICTNGDHSAALSADGHLYTWGRGFCGVSDAYCPQRLPSSLQFIQAALGWSHAFALTGDGEVFMHGGNFHGVLSHPQKMSPVMQFSEDSREADLMKVPGLEGIKVVQIAAGAEHSGLVTEKGVIKMWGWGEHGQLGLGDTCDQTTPQAVSLAQQISNNEHSVTKIFCGSGFTYAVRMLHLTSQT
ncbi:ultraviolet-B receptor UVR8 isoform X2 [Malania oleifera]|uniref:ultraviolet-B receptor UVR8 isoform X2 n=1 Tax=Malania oleifera TaxID=397392 RepID=UPI0025AE9C3B|nr:ultraviolet-B receptor UVR8 isoform X2 [Malania oleifera]